MTVCVHRVYLMVRAWQETHEAFHLWVAVTFKFCSWFCLSLSLPVIWFSYLKLKSLNDENNQFKLFMKHPSVYKVYIVTHKVLAQSRFAG